MDAQTQQSLMSLLSDMVAAIKQYNAELHSVRDALADLSKKLEVLDKPAPAKKRSASKKKAEPEPQQNVEVPQGTQPFLDAMWQMMQKDYGTDVPAPDIQQGEGFFIVNGERIESATLGSIVSALQSFEAATPADIASECGVPLAAVYLVKVLLSRQQG